MCGGEEGGGGDASQEQSPGDNDCGLLCPPSLSRFITITLALNIFSRPPAALSLYCSPPSQMNTYTHTHAHTPPHTHTHTHTHWTPSSCLSKLVTLIFTEIKHWEQWPFSLSLFRFALFYRSRRELHQKVNDLNAGINEQPQLRLHVSWILHQELTYKL